MLELPQDRQESEILLTSFMRLGGNLDFKRIKDWLVVQQTNLLRANVDEKDEINIRWVQGSIQTLDEFFHYATTARDLVEKYRENNL